MSLKDKILIVRPWSLVISLISVTGGTAFAFYEGYPFNPLFYVLALIGAVSAQTAVNVIDDYFDVIYGADKPNAPTAKYRPHLVLQGIYRPVDLIYMTMGLIGIGTIVAIVLFILSRPLVLLFGALAVFLIYIWAGPPFKLKYIGLAEFENFLVFGPVMVTAAYYVQSGIVTTSAILASIPFGFSEAVIDYANNLRDVEYDKEAKARTIPIILGKEKALLLYDFLIILPNIVVIILVALGIFKPISLITLISLPLAIQLIRKFKKQIPLTADPETSKHNILFASLLIISFIIAGLNLI